MEKKRNKKSKQHMVYNKKVFLAPDSLLSMAAMHTKIKSCGEAQIRISDCNNTIKLWNNLNDKREVKEFLIKIDSIIAGLQEFKEEVKVKLPIYQ